MLEAVQNEHDRLAAPERRVPQTRASVAPPSSSPLASSSTASSSGSQNRRWDDSECDSAKIEGLDVELDTVVDVERGNGGGNMLTRALSRVVTPPRTRTGASPSPRPTSPSDHRNRPLETALGFLRSPVPLFSRPHPRLMPASGDRDLPERDRDRDRPPNRPPRTSEEQ